MRVSACPRQEKMRFRRLGLRDARTREMPCANSRKPLPRIRQKLPAFRQFSCEPAVLRRRADEAPSITGDVGKYSDVAVRFAARCGEELHARSVEVLDLEEFHEEADGRVVVADHDGNETQMHAASIGDRSCPAPTTPPSTALTSRRAAVACTDDRGVAAIMHNHAIRIAISLMIADSLAAI